MPFHFVPLFLLIFVFLLQFPASHCCSCALASSIDFELCSANYIVALKLIDMDVVLDEKCQNWTISSFRERNWLADILQHSTRPGAVNWSELGKGERVAAFANRTTTMAFRLAHNASFFTHCLRHIFDVQVMEEFKKPAFLNASIKISLDYESMCSISLEVGDEMIMAEQIKEDGIISPSMCSHTICGTFLSPYLNKEALFAFLRWKLAPGTLNCTNVAEKERQFWGDERVFGVENREQREQINEERGKVCDPFKYEFKVKTISPD